MAKGESTGNRPGRPKKPDKRLQGDFNDYIIEDAEIAALIDELIEGEAIAIRVRQAGREIKKLIAAGYPDAINSDADGTGSGYANVLGRRVYCGVVDVPEKQQKAKTIASSRKWVGLDVHRRNLFDNAGEAVE